MKNNPHQATFAVPLPEKFRMPLCPYLMTGNHRLLVHLDAYGIPQSLQWPRPGAPDRLGFRNFCDEWPYWEEMTPEHLALLVPFFEYEDGKRDYLHDAANAYMDYIPDTNVLRGRYELPRGAVVEETLFVPPGEDVFFRHYHIEGKGKFVFQGEFFDKAVRGHALCKHGEIQFRGFLDAAPRGVFVILSSAALTTKKQRTETPVDNIADFDLLLAFGPDLLTASASGRKASEKGFAALLEETINSDRGWLSRAKEPVARHPFILKNYKRWLLSNMLLIAEDGATVSGVRPFWTFAWPRDCAEQAYGFAAAGFLPEAEKIVRWNLDNLPESCVYEARYWSDGTPNLLDNRPRQGDSAGFLIWTAVYLYEIGKNEDFWASVRGKLLKLADHLVEAADSETMLPLPEADHREQIVAESLSTAASAIGGLRALSSLLKAKGEGTRAESYRRRAEEILQAVLANLWDEKEKYFITSVKPTDVKADISICWGALPFRILAADDPRMVGGIMKIYRENWNVEAGGVLSMGGTAYASYWMYYTSLLLLGMKWIGAREKEEEILDSLAKNALPQGLIPEQVSFATGRLWGCAPLPPPQANLLYYAFLS